MGLLWCSTSIVSLLDFLPLWPWPASKYASHKLWKTKHWTKLWKSIFPCSKKKVKLQLFPKRGSQPRPRSGLASKRSPNETTQAAQLRNPNHNRSCAIHPHSSATPAPLQHHSRPTSAPLTHVDYHIAMKYATNASSGHWDAQRCFIDADFRLVRRWCRVVQGGAECCRRF